LRLNPYREPAAAGLVARCGAGTLIAGNVGSRATWQRLAGQEKPAAVTLYEWLNRAFEEKLVRREGAGRKADPYRYRLENKDSKYRDRGELPPLRDLDLGRW
jgi:hypothetical protein